MNPLLKVHQNRIAELCLQYGVDRLEAFGVANTPEFDPKQDDFEFIGVFADDGGDMFLRYTGLMLDLENLLGRPVIIVDENRLKPYFLESIASTREVLFDASSQPVTS